MKTGTVRQWLSAMIFACSVTTAQAQVSDLSVSDLQVTQDQTRLSTITGTATNTAGRPLTDAFLTFNHHDQAGTLVRNVMDHAQNLAVGDHWRFETKTPDHGTQRA